MVFLVYVIYIQLLTISKMLFFFFLFFFDGTDCFNHLSPKLKKIHKQTMFSYGYMLIYNCIGKCNRLILSFLVHYHSKVLTLVLFVVFSALAAFANTVQTVIL